MFIKFYLIWCGFAGAFAKYFGVALFLDTLSYKMRLSLNVLFLTEFSEILNSDYKMTLQLTHVVV